MKTNVSRCYARTRFSHPPYVEMIKAAISSLKERTGSSVQAITKYVEANYKLPDNFKKVLSNQLKKLAAEGKLVKVKASYKLGDALKKAPKKPKAKVRRGTSVCFFCLRQRHNKKNSRADD